MSLMMFALDTTIPSSSVFTSCSISEGPECSSPLSGRGLEKPSLSHDSMIRHSHWDIGPVLITDQHPDMSPPLPWLGSGLKPGIHGLYPGDTNRGAPRQPGTAARDVWLVVAGSQHLGRRPAGGGGGPQSGGAAQLNTPGPGPAAAGGEPGRGRTWRRRPGGEAPEVGADHAVCCGVTRMTVCLLGRTGWWFWMGWYVRW